MLQLRWFWCLYFNFWIFFMYLTLKVSDGRPEELYKKVLWKIYKIRWKMFLLSYPVFIKVVVRGLPIHLKSLQDMCFPVNFAKFLRAPILWMSTNGCFWRLRAWLESLSANPQAFAISRTVECFPMKEMRDKLAWKFLNVFYSFLANKNVFKIDDKKLDKSW